MNAARPAAAQSSYGFTLVELLIAIALLGLITVMLFGSIRFGARATTAASMTNDRTAQLAIAYDFIEAALGNAQSLSLPDGSGDVAPAFDGAPDHLDFLTLPPARLAVGGFHMLHLSLEGSEGRRRLTVSWRLVQRGIDAPEPAELRPSALLDGIASISFAYFGALDQSQMPDWHETWPATNTLPSAVRIDITRTDGRQAPELVVALRLAHIAGSTKSLAPGRHGMHF